MSGKKTKSANAGGGELILDHPSRMEGRLKSFGGSKSDDWNNVIVNQAAGSLWTAGDSDDARNTKMKAMAEGLAGIAPRDEMEGMMAAQLIASHSAAMECYRRAMIPEQSFEGRKENLTQANKLSRTWTTLLEALNKHRGKGQQKMTVEHVHVHSGGQAIVGAVSNPGGGDHPEIEEQAHAKQIAHAPEPALRSQDSEGEPVPISRDE